MSVLAERSAGQGSGHPGVRLRWMNPVTGHEEHGMPASAAGTSTVNNMTERAVRSQESRLRMSIETDFRRGRMC